MQYLGTIYSDLLKSFKKKRFFSTSSFRTFMNMDWNPPENILVGGGGVTIRAQTWAGGRDNELLLFLKQTSSTFASSSDSLLFSSFFSSLLQQHQHLLTQRDASSIFFIFVSVLLLSFCLMTHMVQEEQSPMTLWLTGFTKTLSLLCVCVRAALHWPLLLSTTYEDSTRKLLQIKVTRKCESF